jgi:hypothetical protein
MRQDWVVDNMGVEVRGRRRGQGRAGPAGGAGPGSCIKEEGGDGVVSRKKAVTVRRGGRRRWRGVEEEGGDGVTSREAAAAREAAVV